VTIYERKPIAGGLDTYGMAEYKMPQSVSLSEVDHVEKMGVKVLVNSNIGAQEFELLRSQHDAVFLGVGLGETNKLNIQGEELEGVYDALNFIELVKTRDWKSVPLGKTVAVIGAGNTAIDAVTQAKRLGAEKVIMVYRRTEKDAPAYEYELELARKDGIEFLWNTIPTAIGGHGRVSTLRVRTGEYNEYKIDCDMVIKAIGQTKMTSFFSDVCNVVVDEKGRVVVNDQMQTSDPKIFAGGDCANGGAEAVDASQMGKLAAQGIHFALTGNQITFAGSQV
jgi:glutamate synthase (NADPH/NADH) small chain